MRISDLLFKLFAHDAKLFLQKKKTSVERCLCSRADVGENSTRSDIYYRIQRYRLCLNNLPFVYKLNARSAIRRRASHEYACLRVFASSRFMTSLAVTRLRLTSSDKPTRSATSPQSLSQIFRVNYTPHQILNSCKY